MNVGRKTKQKAASLSKRIYAYMIDLMISFVLLGFFITTAGLFMRDPLLLKQGYFQMLCFIITLMFLFVYYPSKHDGQTIGKTLLNIRVQTKRGTKLPSTRFWIRDFVLKIVLPTVFIPVSFLYWFVMKYIRKQNEVEFLHDKLFSTIVVME